MPKQPLSPKPQELIKHDPDSWLLKLRTPDAIKKWMGTEKDYISDYLVNICMAEANGPKGVAEQVKRMAEVIELIPEDILRNCYYDEVCQAWGAFKKNYKLKKPDAPLPKLEKLAKDDKSAFFDYGFWEKDGAYHTLEKGKEMRICNFTIEILYFVRSNNEPKYVCIFTHMFGRKRISAVTTDDFTSIGQFRKVIGRIGAYVFEGNDNHLNKIKLKLFYGVKEATEPRYMGYNTGGNFYTWANGLYFNEKFFKTDKYGIVELEHPIRSLDDFKKLAPESQVMMNDELHILENPEKFLEKHSEDVVNQYIEQKKAFHMTYYYLPFSTRIRVASDDDEDDNYEFEKKFKHLSVNDKEPLTFKDWSSLMRSAYGENGCIAIAYYCMCLYRDIVFKHNNSYIPLLGFFGPRQSGKSKCAESITKTFGEGLEDGVNLESGSTATGVRRYLASMQNAILWLNEYKNTLPDYTLGMIKGIADGSGKLTGRNTGGNETKNYKPMSGVVLCGQDLPTKDPAIYSRCIPCEFDPAQRNEIAFRELKDLEKEGKVTAVTCEMLNYRERMKKSYPVLEPMMTKRIREHAENVLGQKLEDRMTLNLTSLLTTFLCIAAPQIPDIDDNEEAFNALCTADPSTYAVKFGFSLQQLANALMRKVKAQIDVQHTTDDVEQYFNVLQSLIESRKVLEGHHYKITKGSDGVKKLYLRVQPIHVEYMGTAQRAGMAAMDPGTLRTYIAKHRTYIEYKKDGVHFEHLTNRTSAHVFNYDMLLAQGIEFKSGSDLSKILTNDESI